MQQPYEPILNVQWLKRRNKHNGDKDNGLKESVSRINDTSRFRISKEKLFIF